MNAYAMAGLGQGISQGIKDVGQGMLQRDQVQKQAMMFNQQYQNAQLQQQDTETKLALANLQLQELQRSIAKRDAWDVLSGFEQSGDASILNTVKQNPIMTNILNSLGISGFSNIKDLTPEKQSQLGITPEILNDPSKRIVLTQTANGNQVPLDMMKIYATTGFLPKLGEQKLADIALRANEIKAKTGELKLQDMETYLKNNPSATLSDYIAMSKKKEQSMQPSSLEKETQYIRDNYGEAAAQEYINKKITPADNAPAVVKTDKYTVDKWNELKKESGDVKDIADIDYTKLNTDNRTWLEDRAAKDAKNIKPEERDALFSLSSAADKLKVEDLKNTTGIVDATFNSILDSLGMDLPDPILVQSSNYNLIKNAIIKAAMGSQVTGNELERMTAQLGSEFKADNTVRIKMAETLDNLVAKYQSYKVTAPAFYARAMKDKVDNMTKVAGYLRNPESTKSKNSEASSTTNPNIVKTGDIVNGYQFLGGATNDEKNWKKVNK